MQHCTKWIIRLICAGLAVYSGATANAAAPNDPFPIFRNAAPVKVWHRSLDELAPVFSAFEHKPFDKAGFDEVLLPFVYVDPDGIGKSDEAAAFAFLLSYDLDWAPGCYCARHAYFVFQRDSRLMQPMVQGYTQQSIATAIDRWGATHAVGGVLNRSRNGYSGTLRIFGPDGHALFVKNYQTPESYFDLLGDMAVDAIGYFGPKPTPALTAFLHQPACAQMDSIAKLGSVAFNSERTPDEFALFDHILQADPGFADLRYWSANQKQWEDSKEDEYARQTAIALESRLNMTALEDFDAQKCPDAKLASHFPDWVNKAEALTGGDHPELLRIRFEHNLIGRGGPIVVFRRAMKVAAEYPNSHYLLTNMAAQYDKQDQRALYDEGLSASLYFASLQDLYQPGIGIKANEAYHLGDRCTDLGRPDLAIDLLQGAVSDAPEYRPEILNALCTGGHYAEVLQQYYLLKRPFDYYTCYASLEPAAFAAAVEGRDDMLARIFDETSTMLKPYPGGAEKLQFIQLYRDLLSARPVDLAQIQSPSGVATDFARWLTFVKAQQDEAKSDFARREDVQSYADQNPQDRLAWISYDSYERRQADTDAAAFYDYLGRLYGTDPWVAAAVADFHLRDASATLPDPAKVRDELTLMKAAVNPRDSKPISKDRVVSSWRTAAAIHQLIDQHRIDEAAEIANLNLQIQQATRNGGKSALAFLFVRRVNQAKASH